MNQSVPPVMAKDQFYQVLSKMTPFNALKGHFEVCLKKPTWSPGGKNQNGPEGASRYGQGPILTSINPILPLCCPKLPIWCLGFYIILAPW